MIEGLKVLAIIPARAGSKRVPNKNKLDLGGRPLIEWTIDTARKSKYIDSTCVTTDDSDILRLAEVAELNVVRRTQELSTDMATTVDVVLDVLTKFTDNDIFILLQPTSPFRTEEDIDAALETYVERSAESCVSVSESTETPFFMYFKGKNDIIRPVIKTESSVRTQDLPKTYSLNGAIYIHNQKAFLKDSSFIKDTTVAYVMPAERSLDIDTEEDFRVAELRVRSGL